MRNLRLDFRRSLVSGLPSLSEEERGLLSRTAAGNRAKRNLSLYAASTSCMMTHRWRGVKRDRDKKAHIDLNNAGSDH